jgi:hypothetical protein
MFAKMLCYPPLGQPTIVPRRKRVDFVVVLETSREAAASKQWEVVLWHDLGANGNGWSGISFEEETSQHEVVRRSQLRTENK